MKYRVYILLILVVLIAYWPAYKNGFVYDDALYIVGNAHVHQGINLPDLRWALTTTYGSNWHPLTWISYMLDNQLFGMGPAGPHVINLAIHLLNVLLLFLLLSRLTGMRWQSAFVAALFGVHPLHVESVAWISERKDVLSTFFWLLTMLAYVRYVRRRNLKSYGLMFAAFILGLTAKPMLVSLPFTLLLLDYWPLGRMKGLGIRRLLVEKIPLFVLSAGSCAITYLAQWQGGSLGAEERYPLAARIPNAIMSYERYIAKMLWPTKLAFFYPHPLGTLPLYKVLLAGLMLVAISALVLAFRRSRPYLAFGWLWYLITLVPVIGLVQVGSQAMADRYTYIPSIGLFIMVAWLVPGLLKPTERGGDGVMGRRGEKARIAVPSVACVIIMVCIILTRLQIRYWHDDETLYRHAIAVTSNNAIAHVNLAGVLQESNPRESIRQYHMALSIEPNDLMANHNLAKVLAQQGRYDEAIVYYQKALKANPDHYESHNNLGALLMHQGRLGEAYSQLCEAIMIDFQRPDAHSNLAILLNKLGRPADAMDHAQEAIAIDPNSAQAHYVYAMSLNGLGRLDEAIQQYSIAIQLDPKFALAHSDLATALYFKGDYAGAWREVHLSRRYGGAVNPDFLRALSQKMPDPR